MYEVENPVYQNYSEILKQYKETLVVITNAVWEKDPLEFIGGIVRYYGDDRKKLINKWGELNTLENESKYGKCTFKVLIRDDGVHINERAERFGVSRQGIQNARKKHRKKKKKVSMTA
jgi:hypothetical protein